jgi:hypothetical protein
MYIGQTHKEIVGTRRVHDVEVGFEINELDIVIKPLTFWVRMNADVTEPEKSSVVNWLPELKEQRHADDTISTLPVTRPLLVPNF